MNIEVKRINPNNQEIYSIELLRHQAFHLKKTPEAIQTSYAIFHLKHNQMIAFGLYVDGLLAAGCYVSCPHKSLFVNYLFVGEAYQNTGLRLGRTLLNRVNDIKTELEECFHTQINQSILVPNNEKSRSIYEKIGYEKDGDSPYMCKKI